jgi:glycine cleavage system regulatory protein
MHVLDYPRTAHGWDVTLPLYHRGHLSLRPGTTVHMAWVMRESDRSGDETAATSGLPELFGTTVEDHAWGAVYRISIDLYDAPGVLHQALRSVSLHGGNVLQLDSTSTEKETHHSVEMIVDFASLMHKDQARDLAAEIEGLLLADCAQHIVVDDDGNFAITVRVVSSLRRMHNMLTQIRGDRPVSASRIDQGGVLEFDERIQRLLSDAGISPPFRYLITSDTTDRVFRVTFFPAEQPVVWCSIRHTDKKGALESITDALQKNGITILCALNRVQEHLGQNWFEVVLSSHRWRYADVPQVNLLVRGILEAPDLAKFNLQSFFDPSAAAFAMRPQDPLVKTHRTPHYPLRTDVDEWLNAKVAALATVENKLNAIDSRDRTLSAPAVREANALRSGTAKVRRETDRRQRSIFLSLEFTKQNDAKIDLFEQACRQTGVILDVVRKPKDQKTIWLEVMKRMQQATDFVAIWTPSSKWKNSKRPSPWCVWELGIANALRLPYYVMCDKKTDVKDYTVVHSGRFYYPYDGNKELSAEIHRIVREIAISYDTPRAQWYGGE